MNSIKIGIFGLGTVGSGTTDILTTNTEIIKRQTGLPITIEKICVGNINKTRTIEVDTDILTTNPDDILKNPEIDIVVEVMGGIERSKKVIEAAFKEGKHVVSANKDLIADYGKELTELARENNCHFLYEAAVAGGIPILHSLQYALMGNHIKKIGGIVNGSTNYILTRMEAEKLSLEKIIEDAKALGYLEADPTADLDGLDAARKCAILASIGFNSLVTYNQVSVSGIRNISLEDIHYANKLGYKIKLLAVAENTEKGIVARVQPALLPSKHPLSSVNSSFNAVYVIGDKVGETMFYGRGAGDLPTGSAVVGDVISISKNLIEKNLPEYSYDLYEDKPILPVDELSFPYYLRMKVEEDKKFGLKIFDILDKHNILAHSINQYKTELSEKTIVEYVVITNECKNINFKKAFEKINSLENLLEPAHAIMIEKEL